MSKQESKRVDIYLQWCPLLGLRLLVSKAEFLFVCLFLFALASSNNCILHCNSQMCMYMSSET